MTGVGPAVPLGDGMYLRISLALAIAAALILTSAAPVAAKTPPFAMNPKGGQLSDERTGFNVHDKVHIKNELKALRDEAIATQKADGGKLTDAHRADLEARLAVLRKEACQTGVAGC